MKETPLRILLAATGIASVMTFEKRAFDVRAVEVGVDLLELIDDHRAEVVITDDLALCRMLRTRTPVPLVFVADNDPDRIVAAFTAGAADVVDPLCHARVLQARIRVAMRHAPVPPARYEIGEIVVDPVAAQVHRAGVPVPITPTEYRLLLHFVEHAGIAHTRDELLQTVWGYSWGGDSRLVDVHVARLRAKLGARLLETVRGVGYRFVTS